MIILEISRLRIVDNSEQKSSGNATSAENKYNKKKEFEEQFVEDKEDNSI